MKKFNGEITELKNAFNTLEDFEKANSDLISQWMALQANFQEVENQVKKIAQGYAIELNHDTTKETKQDYKYDREGVKVHSYPSFGNHFNIDVLNESDLVDLQSKGVLTVDGTAYKKSLTRGEISGNVDTLIRSEVLLRASCKVTFNKYFNK